MRYSALISLLVVSQAMANPLDNNYPIIPGYPCPPEDVAGGCRGEKDCLYPNPDNIHGFIQCNDASIAYDMPCAPIDLVWDDESKRCDWPEEQDTTNATSSTTTPAPETTPSPTTQSPTTPCVTHPSFVCPEEDIAATSCLGPKDCLYPNPDDCGSFIACEVNADNTTGRPTIKDCPADLEWNDIIKRCDYPQNSTCPGRVTTPAPTTQPPTTQAPTTQPPTTQAPTTQPPTTQAPTTQPPPTTPAFFICPTEDIAATACMGPKDCLYPFPGDCSKFIHCEVNADNTTGRPTVKDCPDGLYWNDNKKECDYKEDSTCPDRPTRPPTTQTPSTQAPTTQSPTTTTSTTTPCPPPTTTTSTTTTTTPCPPPTTTTSTTTTTPCPPPTTTTTTSTTTTTTPCPTPAPTTTTTSTTTTTTTTPCPPPTTTTTTPCPTPAPTTTTTPCPPPTTTTSTTTPCPTPAPTTTTTPCPTPSTAGPTARPTPPSGPFQCPPEDIINTKCLGPKDCLYPNPASCNNFIQCTVDPGERTGTPVVMPCPAGLQWNDIEKICDWPANSTCPNKK